MISLKELYLELHGQSAGRKPKKPKSDLPYSGTRRPHPRVSTIAKTYHSFVAALASLMAKSKIQKAFSDAEEYTKDNPDAMQLLDKQKDAYAELKAAVQNMKDAGIDLDDFPDLKEYE